MTLRDLVDKIHVKEYSVDLYYYDDVGSHWIGDVYISDIAWIDRYMDCKVTTWSLEKYDRLTLKVFIEF